MLSYKHVQPREGLKMNEAIIQFKKEVEAMSLNSVKELFREATKEGAFFDFIGFSFGCYTSTAFNANNDPIEFTFTWYVLKDARREVLATAVFNPIKEDLSDCINRTLHEVYTHYHIDIWKSIKSKFEYNFTCM